MSEFESHPFMRRWFAGQLRSEDLMAFASEHYQVICALDRAARLAARRSKGLLASELLRYSDRCRESAGPWCEFAAATGWGAAWYFGEDPLPQTVACAEAIVGEEERSLELHLVTIHALESAFAELAPRQRETLGDRYGFDDVDTSYFALRAERSAGAAGMAEAALTGMAGGAGPAERLAAHAAHVRRSYLGLLDAVEALGLGGRGRFGRDRQPDEPERQRQPI
jgi:pyrroloquinoline quinone (PQQ) biosynthesis protein C